MDINKEREAFEAYMAEKYKNLVDKRRCLNNGGGYMAWDMNVAWQAWQAAKVQAVPEGFVVVPKEPTEKMNKAGLQEYRKVIGVGQDDIGYIYKAMIEVQEPAND